jgi:hypothetical protein
MHLSAKKQDRHQMHLFTIACSWRTKCAVASPFHMKGTQSAFYMLIKKYRPLPSAVHQRDCRCRLAPALARTRTWCPIQTGMGRRIQNTAPCFVGGRRGPGGGSGVDAATRQ